MAGVRVFTRDYTPFEIEVVLRRRDDVGQLAMLKDCAHVLMEEHGLSMQEQEPDVFLFQVAMG